MPQVRQIGGQSSKTRITRSFGGRQRPAPAGNRPQGLRRQTGQRAGLALGALALKRPEITKPTRTPIGVTLSGTLSGLTGYLRRSHEVIRHRPVEPGVQAGEGGAAGRLG